jgi:hypothetical protein
MTGEFTLALDPTKPLDAVTKQYVDAKYVASIAQYLPLVGGTMQGPLILAHDPSAVLEAATKQYVDSHTPPNGASLVIGDTAPTTPVPGTLWWDSIGGQLYVWYQDVNSSQWVVANSQPKGVSATVSDVPPASAGNGQLWWDSTAAQLYLRYQDQNSAQWVLANSLASDVAAVVAPAFNAVGRNLLHNPLFNVAQRGVGPWTAFGYTLDRWEIYMASDTDSITQVVLTDADRAAVGDEAAICCVQNVFTGNAAAAAQSTLYQPTESVRRLGGKTVTASFWAKAAAGTPKLGVSIDQYFGTGGSPSAGVNGNGQAVTLSTTWARYSVTIAIASTSGKVVGTNNNDFTGLNFWYSSGATNASRAGNIGVQSGTIQLWGIQLEIGTQATPLEKPDPQQDLAKCQRFYQTGVVNIGGYNAAGSGVSLVLPFPVQMRAQPTITPSFTTQINCGSSGIGSADTTGFGYYVHTNTTALGAVALGGTFTASADL